jgi:hypothetical protein
MARVLVLKNKLSSFLGQIDVHTESEQLAYRAVSEWSWTSARWRLFQGERELAVLRRPWFAWMPAWQVGGALGEFAIERKWSIKRHYTVKGGTYDGTVISGNLWDMSFVIDSPAGPLARASNRLMSLRDRHQVEILDEEAELLCVVAMVVVKADRNSEAAAAAAS